jgi:DNA polymerase III alpha subunit (gram-positive type)
MRHLVIDTETTGLSPRVNKVLTVGLLQIETTKRRLKILNSEHIFIKHNQYNANPFALRINKINLEEHHKIGITPLQACNKINKFILKNKCLETPVMGHNIRFDTNFLAPLFEKEEKTPLFNSETIDTIHIWKSLQAKELIPPQPKSRLSFVAKHFDIDCSKAHDALADCKITAQVYHEMLKLSSN